MDIKHFKEWVTHEVTLAPDCIGIPSKRPLLDHDSDDMLRFIFPTFRRDDSEGVLKDKLMRRITRDIHVIVFHALDKDVNIIFWWNSMSPSHIDLTVKITNINS